MQKMQKRRGGFGNAVLQKIYLLNHLVFNDGLLYVLQYGAPIPARN